MRSPGRFGPPRPVAEVAPVVALLVIVLGGTSASAHWHAQASGLNALGYSLLLAAGLPLLVRNRYPLAAFTASAALAFAYWLAGYPTGPVFVLPTLGLITLACRRKAGVAAIAGGAALVVVITTVLLRGDPQGLLDARLIGLVLWVAVAVTVGSAIRLRRSMVGEAHARLREREQRLAEEERLRIAREVHDVVAHSLAMINVQAGTAAHVADRRPEAAKDALLAIKEASRTALTDLRATLDVLRSGGERAPTPGLARLPDLVTNAAAAGVRVEVTGQAGAGPLPAPVDLAAYRILQESLTNVVRHAEGADTVAVTFHRDAGALVLTVRDNGRTGPARPTRGNGLRGMAERAGALGGEVEAGPVPGGGFEVSARLPMPGRMDEPGTPADTERGVR